MTIEDGLRLALRALSQVLDKNFSVERIAAAYIKTDEKVLKEMQRANIDRVLREVKKK
jgi:20S proteasome alpha/beta subunit